MNKQYLLREYYQLCQNGSCADFLTESEKERVRNGALILTGLLQRAGVENGNGRVYPKNILFREVEKYKKLVQERRSLGECDHPDSPTIELKNASHVITDIWTEGDSVMGKLEVLDHLPGGQIIRGLIKHNIPLGISSRAVGSLTESSGVSMVGEDLTLICFDMVSEPSTPGAFMSLHEVKNWNGLVQHPHINELRMINSSYDIDSLLDDILR